MTTCLTRVLTLASALVCLAANAGPAGPMAVYQDADGQRYFSLSLSTDITADTAAGRDVVVLFDTSASQTAMYRETALAALERCLESLNKNDRVQLAAVDVQTQPLTAGFISPDGADVADALAKLKARAPMGSTNLDAAVFGAAQMFDAQSRADRVVLYIGDGMSNVNLMDGPTHGAARRSAA